MTTLTAGTGSYDLDSTGASTKAVVTYLKETQDGYVLESLRAAAKNKLYPLVNSAVMNGLTEQSTVLRAVSFWKHIITAVLVILLLADGILLTVCFLLSRKQRKVFSKV